MNIKGTGQSTKYSRLIGRFAVHVDSLFIDRVTIPCDESASNEGTCSGMLPLMNGVGGPPSQI